LAPFVGADDDALKLTYAQERARRRVHANDALLDTLRLDRVHVPTLERVAETVKRLSSKESHTAIEQGASEAGDAARAATVRGSRRIPRRMGGRSYPRP
jgi:hypothetical protein